MVARALLRFERRSAVRVDESLSVIEGRYGNATYPRHAHAESTVTMILAGTLRERVGRVEETPGTFSVVVKPRDTEHANEMKAGVHTLQIRLSELAAAAAIASSSASLSLIAHQSGFADQPHLTRHFVKETSVTPAAFRRLLAREV
jgi:AraC-like DNA-binding protein